MLHGTHGSNGFLPMRWVEYDHEEVPISMDKYSIHGRNILSMDLTYPWVPCNICTNGDNCSIGKRDKGSMCRSVQIAKGEGKSI